MPRNPTGITDPMGELAMPAPAPAPARPGGRRIRRTAVPDAVVGTLVAVVVEIMVFAGFISAFLIAKKPLPPILWPPPDQPRFPVAETAGNSVALLLSGLACWLAVRAFRKGSASARPLFLAAGLLGFAFVALQGVEWAQLLVGGLTLRSSLAGAYFYLLVGAHALHAMAGLLVLWWATARLTRGTLQPAQASATRIYWTFVVGLWPVLYWLVYLS